MFVVNRSIILQSFVIFTVFAYLEGTKSYCAESTLSLTSNSLYLTDAFNWAKPEALSNVRTGQGNNIPCYQAAIKNPSKPSDNRDVFCIRDWAHHVDGAALLGLNLENYSMLKAFAKEQTAARKWYTAWELNYDGSISDIDYVNDQEFWRILCSMFELVEKGYRMYQWTGDARLYTDADLALFYKRIMVDFLAAHDENNNGIGEEHSNVGWEGAASYNEKDDRVLIETGDVMGCQYQAALAYARFLSLQNDTIGAKSFVAKANSLRNTFNISWYSQNDKLFVSGFTDQSYKPVTSFSYETSWFIPLKEIPQAGSRATDYLDFIYNSFNASPSTNIEAWSYLPDVYYTWNDNERGWYYLKHIMDSRSYYPEISFVTISAIATGLMGISPDAPLHAVATMPRLPSDPEADIQYVELANIPIGNHSITVKHQGNVATTVTHLTGPVNLIWEARFAGVFDSLLVNNVWTKSSSKTINGTEISYVTIPVEPGKSAVVTTGQKLPPEKTSVALVNHGFESGASGWTFLGSAGATNGFSHGGSQRAWLDPGITNKVSQTVVIPGNGSYKGSLSAWVAASGLQGKLCARVKGGAEKTVLISQNATYNQIAIDSISLMGGDSVELFVTGSSTGWVNVDDFVFVIQKRDDVTRVRAGSLPENFDCRVTVARGRIVIHPVNNQAGLKIEMFGLHGQKVVSSTVSGFSPLEIDASAFAKGMYILRVQGLHSVISESITLF